MNSVELWLLGKLLDAATSPEAKRFILAELKQSESALKGHELLLKVLQVTEEFLAEKAA